MPPNAHVGEERHDADPERVEEAVGHQHAAVDGEDPTERVGEVRRHVEERGEEECEAVVDSSGDGDLAEEVEPAGQPAPHTAELCSESLPAQKYNPPAVGYAEAISAIPSPTTSVIPPTMSQPHTMTTGPP